MKKIICPTDFSSTANNTIEYAANLAQIMNAKIELLNIEQLSPAAPITSGIIARENNMSTASTLKNVCREVNRGFNITCYYDIETTSKTLEKAIRENSSEDDIIVMGTNGIDDSYQYIFGTNTYHVIKKSKCPVLMVPEGIKYSPVNKIVFTWDYSKDHKTAFFQLKSLMENFNPQITFLHLSKQRTSFGDDVFLTLKREVHNYLGNPNNVTFERIYTGDSEDFSEAIDDYMDKSKADMLVATYYDRGPLRNIFHGSLIKDLTEIARYPLLVLHV